MSNLLHDLQDAVAARLDSAEWLGQATPPVRVATESRGDLGSQIAEQMARLNLALIVTTPSFARVGQRLSEGLAVTVGVTVVEHASANRGPTGTRRDYLTVALEVVALLEGFTPSPGHLPLRIESGALVDGGDPEKVFYQLEFGTVVRVGITT